MSRLFACSACFRPVMSISAVRQRVIRPDSSGIARLSSWTQEMGPACRAAPRRFAEAGLQDLPAMAVDEASSGAMKRASGCPISSCRLIPSSVAALRFASTIMQAVSNVRWPTGEKSSSSLITVLRGFDFSLSDAVPHSASPARSDALAVRAQAVAHP